MSSDSHAVDAAREAIDKRVGAPPRLVLPEKFEFSSSWRRAQVAPHEVGPSRDAAHFDVVLGYEDGDDLGDHHRVLFAIENGALRAECSCKAWTYRDWCAHVALLYWKWRALNEIGVTNLDTDETHHSRPYWLFVPAEGEEEPL
ncbi:SWIM zinc finger family protein [Halocalculus aciditolerans]|uniref:SWIM-type domain-containing protein n=1 Tax=Halocalculus aciditolerans TaxID=1383812 RepID=A0A830FB36_9EURY|nr:SWIM zinc finger family protein [Halocalculus aciditolerans]GGL57443.1 hypothetical protein GCM10009039_14510 [Halocalculus aciditolerans]